MSAVPSIEYTQWVEFSTDYAAKTESLDSLRKKTNGLAMLIDASWPIGSIHTSVNNVNPSTTIGIGTWIAHSTGVGTYSFVRTA